MENNTTPPREIYVSKSLAEFSISELLTPKGLEIYPFKYLSEQSVLEMLAEKNKEIERLKSDLEYFETKQTPTQILNLL